MKMLNPLLGGVSAVRLGWVRETIPTPALRDRCRSSPPLQGRGFSKESLRIMVKRAPARRRPRKAKAGTKGLTPEECRLEKPAGAAAEVSEAIEKAGGCVVGS